MAKIFSSGCHTHGVELSAIFLETDRLHPATCLKSGSAKSDTAALSVSTRIEPKEVIVRHSTDVLAIADRHIAAAMNMIRVGAYSGLTISEIVQRLPVSRNQLEKRFRRYIGRSPQAEIRHVQMARVKQLLIETDYPLRSIAELAGFEYVEYLCRLFKRVTGETPGTFRRGLRPSED